MYGHLSREDVAKRAREVRYAQALDRLDSERLAHDYLVAQGNSAQRITGENLKRLSQTVDQARADLDR